MNGVFTIRRKKGSVEDRMDLPGRREFQLIRVGRDDFGDCEGSFPFSCEFRVLNSAFQVFGFKPNLIVDRERGKGGTCSLLHDLSG